MGRPRTGGKQITPAEALSKIREHINELNHAETLPSTGFTTTTTSTMPRTKPPRPVSYVGAKAQQLLQEHLSFFHAQKQVNIGLRRSRSVGWEYNVEITMERRGQEKNRSRQTILQPDHECPLDLGQLAN
jgi:hypothetical protein